MKNIYIGKLMNGTYLYSDKDLFEPSERIEFENEKILISYLAGDEMKKIRKRNNLIVKSSLDDNEWLREELLKIGFKSTKIERV
ncbi:MAG: hypothetical protein V1888_00380 [archaeon]